MQVQMDAVGTIVGYGLFTADHPDQTITIADVSDEEAAKLSEPGSKHLNADGSITVTPPDPTAPDPVKEAQEAVVAVQVQTAQALIATSSNQQQAAAMTAFMRTLGLPL